MKTKNTLYCNYDITLPKKLILYDDFSMKCTTDNSTSTIDVLLGKFTY